MHQRPARARGQSHVDETALQTENLPQPFNVAPRQRQHPERQPRFLSRFAIARRRCRRPERVAQRHEQRAEQDGVRQRFGDVVESPPIGVQRGKRLPQPLGWAALQELGHRFEQP